MMASRVAKSWHAPYTNIITSNRPKILSFWTSFHLSLCTPTS